jgi:hypothetical protein
MAAFQFLNFNLLPGDFEVQFFRTVELKAKDNGLLKRYQVTSSTNDYFVVDAKNPYDLWMQLNEFYPQLDIGFVDHIFENIKKEELEQSNITTMNEFVTWYINRFMDKGTDKLSVYEISEEENEYFNDQICDEEESESDDDDDDE